MPSISLRLYRFQQHQQHRDHQAEDEEDTRNQSPENNARLSIEADQRQIIRLFEQHIEREQT